MRRGTNKPCGIAEPEDSVIVFTVENVTNWLHFS
jgi:hypothetical protein